MNRFDKAFMDLVGAIKDDALKVLDDALTYIISRLSINEKTDFKWNHTQEENAAFAEFMYQYVGYMNEQLEKKFWYDAWGDMFMEASGNYKSFRGQFFTPAAVSDLCARIGCDDTPAPALAPVSGRTVVNDCACGSARMLLAAFKMAYDKDAEKPYLIGEDIDGICCKMAAVNLAIHGCFGEIIRHDSLMEPGEFRYGYIVNESLAAGMDFPSIRISTDKKDFFKLRNTIPPVEEGKQLSLF